MGDPIGEWGRKLSIGYLILMAVAFVYAIGDAIVQWVMDPAQSGLRFGALFVLIAIILLGLAIVLLVGAVRAWQLAMIFGLVGGFFGQGWGAVAGVALAGVIGCGIIMARRATPAKR
jgi:hypothetical protein